MLTMLRTIVRSPAYRSHVGELTSRDPDDVWYDPEQGWITTFALKGTEHVERLLLFALEGPIPNKTMALKVAMRIEREDERVVGRCLEGSAAGG